MKHIIDLARAGNKEEFKAAVKQELTQRSNAFLETAKKEMFASIGQKKK